ncbi:hypothetical protein [Lentisalinibacter salinarum]|uniref:hypothetical protein n=1 Tax=Lentisalinibacter salinarum TaxID=2992239 RepID=UPI00386319AF
MRRLTLQLTLMTACLCFAAAPGRAGVLELQQALEGSGAAPLLGDDEPVRFFLRLVAACGEDEELASLSVSIADTRLTPDPGSLDDDGSTEVTLAVSPRQLQGINRRLLCSDTEAAEGSLKLLRGAFSATASARCSHAERGSRLLYASTDVDVSYWCPGADQSPEDAAGR